MVLMMVLPRSSVLGPALKEVIQEPSLFPVLFGGLSFGFSDEVTRALPLPAGAFPNGSSRNGYRLGGSLIINSCPALLFRAAVVPGDPPHHLTAGVVFLEGVHPEQAETRMTAAVLAARRGMTPLTVARREPQRPVGDR